MKTKKINKIIYTLILLISIYILSMFFPNSIFATTYTYTNSSNDLPANFDTLYPGYRSLIETVISEHPAWTIKLYDTDLIWDTVINNEYQGHGSSPKNLVPANNISYSGDWICSTCGTRAYDSGSWYCASRSAIEYMMDPRNSLNSNDLFQFQDLSSSTADRTAIQTMVNGTFINNTECIDAIFTGATTYNVSPYHLVSRILQEQGSNGSTLGLGITESGTTYYNLFNIGAAGNSSATVIANGLARAKSEGWTSMGAAIIGGAKFVAQNYIAIGQNTVYYQKFNVVYADNLYGHQYMQNILAAQNEGISMKNKYNACGISNSSFAFNIPLYTSMPGSSCLRPSITSQNLEEGEPVTINSDSTLILRDAPGGNYLGELAGGIVISRLEKATGKVNEYYWDKVSTPIGTGYMARESKDGSKVYLVPVYEEKPVDISINNGYSLPDESNIIKAEPNVTVNKIKETYTTAVVKNKNEEEIIGDALVGTGAKIIIEGIEKYTIVKMGDVSGDGKISPLDYVKVKNHIMGATTLDEFFKQSADINKDEKISPLDYVKIKNHIMGVTTITL